MKKVLNFILIGAAILGGFHLPLNATENSTKYLERRIPRGDKRYRSFVIALDLLEERGGRILVETGTARGGEGNYIGDGGSTIIFSHWAAEHDGNLFSVDINGQAVETAKRVTLPYLPHVEIVKDDSIHFLQSFNAPIDFLYLDSFDFTLDNPHPSQRHHLKEIQAAYANLHENSIVMIDDCALPEGGKGGLVTEFLLERGWHIHFDGYQRIFLQTPPDAL